MSCPRPPPSRRCRKKKRSTSSDADCATVGPVRKPERGHATCERPSPRAGTRPDPHPGTPPPPRPRGGPADGRGRHPRLPPGQAQGRVAAGPPRRCLAAAPPPARGGLAPIQATVPIGKEAHRERVGTYV